MNLTGGGLLLTLSPWIGGSAALIIPDLRPTETRSRIWSAIILGAVAVRVGRESFKQITEGASASVDAEKSLSFLAMALRSVSAPYKSSAL